MIYLHRSSENNPDVSIFAVLRVHYWLRPTQSAFLVQDPLDISAAVSEITVLRIATHTVGFFGTGHLETNPAVSEFTVLWVHCGLRPTQPAFLAQDIWKLTLQCQKLRSCGYTADCNPHSRLFWHRTSGN